MAIKYRLILFSITECWFVFVNQKKFYIWILTVPPRNLLLNQGCILESEKYSIKFCSRDERREDAWWNMEVKRIYNRCLDRTVPHVREVGRWQILAGCSDTKNWVLNLKFKKWFVTVLAQGEERRVSSQVVLRAVTQVIRRCLQFLRYTTPAGDLLNIYWSLSPCKVQLTGHCTSPNF
jgi:hypothetical protein